ncbi:hypothetical protein [Prochlorococcus marinus]|nr:hypothetical protein [Prochlorococcus marinus]
MTSKAFDAFIEDCFLNNDPICDLRREDSLELDRYASKLLAEMISTQDKA